MENFLPNVDKEMLDNWIMQDKLEDAPIFRSLSTSGVGAYFWEKMMSMETGRKPKTTADLREV